MKRLIILLALVVVTLTVAAQTYTTASVPNPKLRCNSCYVSNPDGILSSSAEQRLNQILTNLEAKNSVQVAVVVINSIGDYDEYTFVHELFNLWRIGKEGKDNGVLILFVSDIRAVKIETGYGVEGLLPDAACEGILNDVMFPYFKSGKYDEGFVAGVEAIQERLTTDAAMEELLLNTNSTQSNLVNGLVVYLVIAFVFLVILSWWSYFVVRSLKGENNLQYGQLAGIASVATILAFIFPLPVALFAWWIRHKRKKVRRQPIPCHACGKSMHLLTEKEEDAYLQSAEIAEEVVKSVDYDVWLCDACKATRVLPYASAFTTYKKCPNCGAKTYKLERDEVAVQATTLHAGQGEKVYECQHCKFKKVVPYVIPMIVVAAAVGRSGGRGGFGGGFGGGSGFGGGFSGGGGAGGRF